MMNSAIGGFTHSQQFVFLLGNLGKEEGEHMEHLMDFLNDKAQHLQLFLDQLLCTVSNLKPKGLTPELALCSSDRNFKHVMCKTIKDCLISAYGIQPSPSDIDPAYLAVLIREESGSVVGCALADFRPYPSNEFVTRMEAVSKARQRQQIGTELFRFVELSVQFLMQVDGYVRISMSGETQCTLKAYVDIDAPDWHVVMMQNLGFEEDEDPFEWRGDIGFSKSIADRVAGIRLCTQD
jgi:hypothetical protein